MFDWKRLLNFKDRDRKLYLDLIMFNYDFSLIGEGVHRRTYLSSNKRYVLKFPIVLEGLYVNREEHRKWHNTKSKRTDNGIYLAPCRLINNTVLMMWACDIIYGWSDGCYDAEENTNIHRMNEEISVPEWVDLIDCCQAGHLRANGKLVAYDYG